MRFYGPQDPRQVSHSIGNIQGTGDYFTSACRTVLSLMAELGHDHLDLLKLDIEGAEVQVIEDLLRDGRRGCSSSSTPQNLLTGR